MGSERRERSPRQGGHWRKIGGGMRRRRGGAEEEEEVETDDEDEDGEAEEEGDWKRGGRREQTTDGPSGCGARLPVPFASSFRPLVIIGREFLLPLA